MEGCRLQGERGQHQSTTTAELLPRINPLWRNVKETTRNKQERINCSSVQKMELGRCEKSFSQQMQTHRNNRNPILKVRNPQGVDIPNKKSTDESQ